MGLLGPVPHRPEPEVCATADPHARLRQVPRGWDLRSRPKPDTPEYTRPTRTYSYIGGRRARGRASTSNEAVPRPPNSGHSRHPKGGDYERAWTPPRAWLCPTGATSDRDLPRGIPPRRGKVDKFSLLEDSRHRRERAIGNGGLNHAKADGGGGCRRARQCADGGRRGGRSQWRLESHSGEVGAEDRRHL